MKILHFIPNLHTLAGSNIFQYKPVLLRSMSESADVHLLTCRPVKEQLNTVNIHICSVIKLLFLTGRSSLGRQLSSINPDIVHIHACWSLTAYRLYKWCVKNRKPVVLTVDRQLEPWHVLHRYWLCKLPMLLMFQRYMIRHADALHAVTAQEENFFRSGNVPYRLSCGGLNERIGQICIPCQPGMMSTKDMSGAMIRFYRKVLDSRPFISMTETDKRAEDILLACGMSQNEKAVHISDEEKLLFKSLDINSWRRILLHSNDEGILDEVRKGCEVLSVSIPPVNVSTAERFPYNVSYDENKKNDSYESKARKLGTDENLSGIELDICVMLMSVLSKIRHSQIKRADLAGLYRVLRFSDYDETQLAMKTRELKMHKSVARILQILKERYALGEGFMFLEPLSDRSTKQLRKELFKSDIQ